MKSYNIHQCHYCSLCTGNKELVNSFQLGWTWWMDHCSYLETQKIRRGQGRQNVLITNYILRCDIELI
jgi:hypothetical protein